MGTINDILAAFIKLSDVERQRLVREMQVISLQERGKEANKNLLKGKVQRGSAADLMDEINRD